jgi:hypothetical protein
MRTPSHMVIGAVVGALPDVMLVTFAWRKKWMPESNALVKAHRLLHDPRVIPVVVGLAWASHLLADYYSPHRTGPNQNWKGEPKR